MKTIRFFVAILVCMISQIVNGQDVIVYTIDGLEKRISKVDSIAFTPNTTIFQKDGSKVSFDPREIDSVVYSRNCIQFKDSVVKSILLAHGVGSNGEISYEEAAKVTSIEQWFRGNTEIKSFDEFQYFTSVVMNGTREFNACTNLESIVLPPSVDYLLNDAFCDAKKLNNIVITSKNFHTFGEGCLARTGLSGDFVMPQTLTTISKSAFWGEIDIEKYFIPSSVTVIGDYAFAYVDKCKDIYIYADTPPTLGVDNFEKFAPGFMIHVPKGSLAAYKEANNWRAISSRMVEFDPTHIDPWKGIYPDYSHCIQFRDPIVKQILLSHGVGSNGEITYEEAANVTSIGQWFRGNTEITSFDEFQYFTNAVMDSTMEFNACTNLESIILPPSVDYLLNNAFCDAKKLNNFVITSSKFHTFGEGCLARTGLSGEFVMPITITTIGLNAFMEGLSVTKFFIPSGVTSIGQGAFARINMCTDIYIYAETPPQLGILNFMIRPANFKIHVPNGTLNKYSTAANWRPFSSCMVEFDTTEIYPWESTLPDNPDQKDDSKITSKISASYRGGVVNMINGVIQNGSQLNFQFENNSNENVILNGLNLIDGAKGTEGNFMTTNDVVVEAGKSVAYSVTVGSAGITNPICRFTYTYNGKRYTVEAAYVEIKI